MGVRFEEHLAIRFHFGAMVVTVQHANLANQTIAARVRLVISQNLPQAVWIGIHEFCAFESDVRGNQCRRLPQPR
jgi:hypothetical protein